MAHARGAERGSQQVAVLGTVAAMILAAMLSTLAVVGGLNLFPAQPSGIAADSAVLESGQAWEAQRRSQSGIGYISAAVLESGQAWEAERGAQEGR